MMKRIAALLAALILLVGCGKSDSTSVAPPAVSVDASAQSGVEFQFSDLEDSVFTMVYEPVDGAKSRYELGLNMPDGYDSDWTGDNGFDCNFTIFDIKSKTSYATVRVQTAPPSLADYYRTDDPEKIRDEMKATFFSAQDVHDGLRKNIVEDFGYTLVVDRMGTALGWNASYIEFIDPASKTHSLRFYLCNDTFDEKFFAFDFKANIPMDDAARIDQLRKILFSLHKM